MKLAAISITNFRPFRNAVRIELGDITTFVGKNDVGKSSILDALEIFFGGDHVSIDPDDANKFTGDKEVRIACEFSDFPESVVLDTDSQTSFKDEYLLNEHGLLEIHKVFDCSKAKVPAPKIYAKAVHPTVETVSNLLSLKNPELKKLLAEFSIPKTEVDMRSNPALRAAIRARVSDLKTSPAMIPLNDDNRKVIWAAIEKSLPQYALFQADRPSTDADAEVQDPMKVAIKAALRKVSPELDRIKQHVEQSATEVARRTIAKLREVDESLATRLNPQFQEPKWEGIFKLSLTGQGDIPLNKRGSGIRRLVLLSFFRAEAERRAEERQESAVIYAIEEPETSQHPHNQRVLVNALMELSEQDNTQVLTTSHNPALAGFLPVDSIRYVQSYDKGIEVAKCSEETLRIVADELGVLPDNRVNVLICVEGVNDISFLTIVSGILHEGRPEIPDLSSDQRFAWIPLGGSSLQQWVANEYLKPLRKRQIHLYDRDVPAYEAYAAEVNGWNDGSFAMITERREMENYIHPEAISEAIGIAVQL